jgi:hypothetical protein
VEGRRVLLTGGLEGRRALAGGPAAVAAWALLGLVSAICVLTLVILGAKLSFFNDDWFLLLQRPGLTADSVLTPHNGHLTALTVLSYKGLVAVFGLGSQVPFRLLLAATIVSLGVVVYVLVSERVGWLLGLVAATLVMFLGPAWEDLLFFASISQVGALSAGLAALLALECDTPKRNVLACLLLVCSILIFDLGIAFVVAAAIAVLLRRRPVQLWIPAIPTLLYGIWLLAYRSDVKSHVSLTNIEQLPRYVVDSVGFGLASITGLNGTALPAPHAGPLPTNYTVAHLLVLMVAIGVAVRLIRGGRPASRLIVVVGAALTFWVLAGANFTPGREPYASRYQLVDATLLIVIGAELFRSVRPKRWQTGTVVALALAALVSNLVSLRDGFRFMQYNSAYAKADLGVLEITRGVSRPDFRLLPSVAHNPYLSGVTARRYFSETSEHGSPSVDSPAQIAAASPAQRQAADNVLAAATGLLPYKVNRPANRHDCRQFSLSSVNGHAQVTIPSGGALVTDLGVSPVALGMRRFAPADHSLSLGTLAAGSSVRIPTRPDGLSPRWRLTASGASALEICPA